MRPWFTLGRQALAAFLCPSVLCAPVLCLSVLVWSIVPHVTHVPSITGTLEYHAEMIAGHGHSHGLEEDLYRALHGHGHDADHHDHSHAVAAFGASSDPVFAGRDAWPLRPEPTGPSRGARIERPPRV